MRNDLEQFENRSDDWLAKQRKYESRVSAWDLDEGRRLKEDHERRHRAYIEDEKAEQEIRSRLKERNSDKQLDTKAFVSAMQLIISISIILMIIISNL